MTGELEEECSLLQISPLEEPVSSDANIPVTQPAFINSNMTIEDTCLYTSTIPADLAASFTGGTVLQIMPDSTIVAVAVKDLPTSTESAAVFKDSPFPLESTQAAIHLPHLLSESVESSASAAVEVPVCSEENISDIDLSFLNETGAMADPKCLNENAVKALQGMMADVSSQSLNLLQNSLNISGNNDTSCEDLEQTSCEPSKDTDSGGGGEVVMIDVTKPIQLSQNSLIMVNGQKCILQHDPQTGQVIAYPVKEHDRPRRRRGRPRKASVEQASQDSEMVESSLAQEAESFSEEERVKGLLEVVNDDGSMVRRSSRKRKKAKVLRDYETGNLKQELGSDVEESEVLEQDPETFSRKKKGPGRPRKLLPQSGENVLANGVVKRQRGRPRKFPERTQAFLVQTADGQTLMMQVPVSSIPPGVSLQEMAQEIANKLNLGLKQQQASQVPLPGASDGEGVVPALQDDCVGSTTHSQCDEDIQHVGGEEVCEVQEIVLESEGSAKDLIPVMSDSISSNQSTLNPLEVHRCSDDNYGLNGPSTVDSSMDNSSILCNLNEHLMDHDFYTLKAQDPSDVSESPKMPDDLLIKSDILKDKVNLQVFLNNEAQTETPSRSIGVDRMLDKKFGTSHSDNFVLNVDPLKDLIKNTKNSESKQYLVSQNPDIESTGVTVSENRENNGCTPDESVDGGNVVDEEYLNTVETNPGIQTCSQFVKTDKNGTIEVILPLATPGDKPGCATSVIPVSEKVLPMLLPLPGSKKCKICKIPYFTEEEIIEHFKAKHPKCICLECNYMNEHPYGIRRHAYRHNEKECVCNICHKKYKDLYILKMHIKMVHLPPEVLFKCTTCWKQFTRKAHLKRHQRIHAAVKQYQCPHCDYKGCEKSDITKHLLIHEEPKFKCDICGKTFRHIKNKDLHLKRHSGQRDYKCAACNFYGYTYTDIRKHIERRHSAACNTCKQTFADVELLKEHRRRGVCQEEKSEAPPDTKEITLYNEIPLDLLETEQTQIMACSEETLSALQSGGQLIIEENNLLAQDNLSLLSVEGDASKMITLVTSSGKNISLPIKDCSSLPLECVTTTVGANISETFFLHNESDSAS